MLVPGFGRQRVGHCAAAVALGMAALAMSAAPASAGTTTFGCTGAPQTYTVPDGIDTISVRARGAAGRGPNGGEGGVVAAAVRVRPGQELEVVVGCRGDDRTGGYGLHRGGDGGPATNRYHGHGGGGSSGVRLGETILVEAGGGGGAGGGSGWGGGDWAGKGGFGGNPPQSGSKGRGAMPGSGGDGGGAGTFHGGAGGSVTAKLSQSGAGGGGGGGHLGGGGGDSGKHGAAGGGGGGGRSYAARGVMQPTFETAAEGGHGEVAITADVSEVLAVRPYAAPAAGGTTVEVIGIDIADATAIAFGEACVFPGACFGNAAPSFECRADVKQPDGDVLDVCKVVTPPWTDDIVPLVRGAEFAWVFVRVATPAGVSAKPSVFRSALVYLFSEQNPPDFVIEAPRIGGVYALDADLHAKFSCRANYDGPVATCHAMQDGVVLGADAALDTSTPGRKHVVFRAVDTLGQVTETKVTYVVDGTRPSIAVTAPSDGASYERAAELDLLYACRDEGGADDLKTCTAEVDGERVASGSPLPTGAYGQHVVKLSATDRAGNTAERTVRYSVVRREQGSRAPRITVMEPGDDAVVRIDEELRTRFTCRASGRGRRIVDCFAQQSDEPVESGDALETSQPGRQTLTVTASDDAGRVSTRSVEYVVELPSPPRVEISSPSEGVVVRAGDPLRAIYECTDPDGAANLTSCAGPVPNGALLDTSEVGEHTVSVRADNRAGLSSQRSVRYRVVPRDTEPPQIQIASPGDGIAYLAGGYVPARYSCRDAESEVVSCAGTVPNGGRLDTSGHGVHTLTVTARDAAGNEATRTVSYVTVFSFGPPSPAPDDPASGDAPPVVDLRTPFEGDIYPQGAFVPASFTCTDPDRDLVSCTGPVASGEAVDTSTLGGHPFTVVGIDRGGRAGYATMPYTVVDADAPSISVESPVVGRHYPRGSDVTVDYSCGTATSCDGTQADGSTLDTSTPGRNFLMVTAEDGHGTTRRTVVYYVD